MEEKERKQLENQGTMVARNTPGLSLMSGTLDFFGKRTAAEVKNRKTTPAAKIFSQKCTIVY